MKISIMIEGQNGLNWDRWKKLVEVTEKNGIYGLYRSDHFTNNNLPDKDSLELWVSLTYLASTTKRIMFGPLVSPMSFRNPVFTTRMASAVDDLSNGRLKLGLGAGWQEREHHNYGFNLLDPEQRFSRFEEGLKIITGLFTANTPFSFDGEFYQLNNAVLLPKPHRDGGPEIVIGGNGKRFTIPMVVAYANEWNTVFIPPEKFASLNAALDKELAESNKRGKKIRRTLMTNLTYAQTDSELTNKLNGKDIAELEQQGIVVGKSPQVIGKLKQYEKLGCEEIMLQWIDLDDMDGLVHFSKNVLPEFH